MGKISDIISRKSSLIIATTAQVLLAGSYIGGFLLISEPSSVFWIIIIGQMLRAGAYAFYWPSIQALLSEMPHGSGSAHEQSISFFCISWSAGQALGSLVAGLVANFSIILGFIIVGGMYVVGFLVVVLSIRKTKMGHPNERIESTEQMPQNQIPHELDPLPQPRRHISTVSVILLLGTLTFAFGAKIMLGYFPNYAVLEDGLAWSESQTGSIIFVFGVGQFLAFVLGSFFRNSLKLLYVVIFIMGLLFLLLFVVTAIIPLGIILFCLGLCVGTTYFVSLELTLKHESSGKGARAGWFESMVGLGTGIVPLIAGKIAEIQLQAPFLFVCVIITTLLGAMLVLNHARNKPA